MTLRVLLLLAGWLALIGCAATSADEDRRTSQSRRSRELRIAAASSLQPLMTRWIDAFQLEHQEITVTVTYGASGKLCTLLLQEAPFDLFYSADLVYPAQLRDQQRALPGSYAEYAAGSLVLWVRQSSALSLEEGRETVLRDPSIRKVAIADPDTAPYGAAALQAISFWGLDAILEDRLVYGDNLAQTAQFVDSGAADIGFLARSLVQHPPLAERGRYWAIPEEVVPPILHARVTLRWVRDPEAASQFNAFVDSPAGQQALLACGYQQVTG
ncbi:MAG: hypothetical protein GEEBNDBF_00651 [bacterium]|nr:hypothetical protein [bacterium]